MEEERLISRYPVDENYKDLLITEPAIIIDRHGRIVAWYLPGALSNSRQVRLENPITKVTIDFVHRQALIWTAAVNADESFAGSLGADGSSWRSDAGCFKAFGTCSPQPGNINLSPAWFQQARDVCSLCDYRPSG